MGVFNMNSTLVRVMEKIGDLIILNLMFLLCSLPLITIGASISALYYTALKLIRNNEGSIIREFFYAFRSNLKQATAIHLIMTAAGGVLVFDFYYMQFVIHAAGILYTFWLLVFILLAIVYYLTLLYVYGVLAQFHNTTRQTIKNALLLAVSYPKHTLLILICPAITVVMLSINVKSFFWTITLYLIIGFSGSIYGQSLLLKHIFDTLIPGKEQQL